MQELSLAASMLEQTAHLVRNKTDIKKVQGTIGPLAGVYADSLKFGFTELAEAEGYKNVAVCIN